MRLLPPLLLLAASFGARAQDRAEVVNRSGKPWVLALVEGAQPGRGSLTLLDKFTGRTLGTLRRAGDRVELPPQAHCLAIYGRDNGYLFLGFILRDVFGWYAEYRASVEYLSSPRITVGLVGQHVGPPLDRAEDGEVAQRLGDFIEIGSENIIIHPNSLGPSPDRPKGPRIPTIPET